MDVDSLTATIPQVVAMIGGAFIMFFVLKRQIGSGLEKTLANLGIQLTTQHKELTEKMEANRIETKKDLTSLHTTITTVRTELRDDMKDKNKELTERVQHLERRE